jgi:hypothetical protein
MGMREEEFTQDEDEFDMWNELGVPCGGYSSRIDFLVIEIMKNLQFPILPYVTDIAKKLEVSEDFVELVQYILCSKDLFEYGVSPRGCFPKSYDQVKEFIEKCEEQYKKLWDK